MLAWSCPKCSLWGVLSSQAGAAAVGLASQCRDQLSGLVVGLLLSSKEGSKRL